MVVARFRDRQRAALLDQLGQVDALDILHRQEVGAVGLVGVVGLDNVRMIELGGGMDFALKPLDRLRTGQPFLANDLEGDDAAHLVVPGLEDCPHAALAERVPGRRNCPGAGRRRDRCRSG